MTHLQFATTVFGEQVRLLSDAFLDLIINYQYIMYDFYL